jgi:hypothetical protein
MAGHGYPPEFRRRVLDLVAAGKKISEVAHDLGSSEQSIYTMRGRCVCELCNHRMQGSVQKGSAYMRCLWASGRGSAGAKATGHPGSLQVREQLLVDEAKRFLAARVFAPEALLGLRTEIEDVSDSPRQDPAADVRDRRARIVEIDIAIDRQALGWEKYDDPNHALVLAAERRIEQLATEKRELEAELTAIEAAPPQPPVVDSIEILCALPDLRPALETYTDEELAELFDVFDLEVRHNHTDKTIALSAAVFPELAELLEEKRPLEVAGRSKPFIAGARNERVPATAFRIREVRSLGMA